MPFWLRLDDVVDALARIVFMLKATSDYQAGASLRDISEKYDVPYTTVNKLFKEHNIKLRRMGRPRDKRY